MKTLCLTLALLLLAVCSISAHPAALQLSAAPQNCCFRFNVHKLKQSLVTDVTKSHSLCLKEAFIVKTVRGRLLCYSHTSKWAQGLYRQFQGTEGSGLGA